MNKYKKNQPSKKRFYTNEYIRASIVRLIDESDQLIGDISKSEALIKARNAGLDLVLVGPTQNPPVAKILDFGKFIYEQKRKEKKNKAGTKETEVKEVRLSFNLSEHDREVKLNRALKFISQGHRIKLQLRLKGRENIFSQKAIEMLEAFAKNIGMEFEQRPQKQGRAFSVLLKKKEVNKTNEDQNPQG